MKISRHDSGARCLSRKAASALASNEDLRAPEERIPEGLKFVASTRTLARHLDDALGHLKMEWRQFLPSYELQALPAQYMAIERSVASLREQDPRLLPSET